MPKDIVLVVRSCSVFLIRRSYISSLCTKKSPINEMGFHDLMIYRSLSLISVSFSCGLLFSLFLVRRHSKVDS